MTPLQSFLSNLIPWSQSSKPGARKLPGVFGIVTEEKSKAKRNSWMRSHRMNLRGGKGSVQERLPSILNKYKGQNVYFETGLKNPHKIKARTKTDNIQGKRGTADEVSAVLCFALDIDCAQGDHALGNLPPRHSALDFLRHDCPMQPSIVIDSGGGYHAYWLLDRPYIIESKEDQREIEAYKKGFQQFIGEQFRQRGWHLDNVSDLSRVLRLPGTSNEKYPGHIVDFEYFDDQPWNFGDVRFCVEDFDPYKATVEAVSYEGGDYNPEISIKGSATGKMRIIEAIRQVCAEAGQIHRGKRLPLTGWLLRSGVAKEDVFEIVLEGTCHHRAKIDGIENARAVARSCVDSTILNLKQGKKVSGFPKFSESIGEDNASKIGELVFQEYQDKEGQRELAAFLKKLPSIQFDNTAHLEAERAKAEALESRRASFAMAPATTKNMLRIFAENNEALAWDLIRVFEIEKVSNLPRDLFAEAFSGLGLSEDWLEDARTKTIESDDAKKIRKTMRDAYKILGDRFWELLKAFSACIAQPLLETISILELHQSVHYSDEGFMEHMKFESSDYAHKLTGLNECGKYDCKTYLDDVTSSDHGKLMRSFRSTCKHSSCSRCQGFYVKEQYEHLKNVADEWTGDMVTVEIPADGDRPSATVKEWNRAAYKLRGIGFRGALHPTFKPLDISAGAFLVSEVAHLDLYKEAFPGLQVKVMSGEEALHRFSLMINLNAIRTREMVITRDTEIANNPWLGTIKMARKRGDCSAFTWMSFRAWKDFKRSTADEPADNRPGIHVYSNVKTNIETDRHSSEEPPKQTHEIIKKANECEPLQLAKDAQILAQCGQAIGSLIVSKRKADRAYRDRIKSDAEILNTMIQ